MGLDNNHIKYDDEKKESISPCSCAEYKIWPRIGKGMSMVVQHEINHLTGFSFFDRIKCTCIKDFYSLNNNNPDFKMGSSYQLSLK